jgi:hypothetical protein
MLEPHVGEYVYEPVLVVGHTADSVGGIGLSICSHDKDEEDDTFSAPVQVCAACVICAASVAPLCPGMACDGIMVTFQKCSGCLLGFDYWLASMVYT